MAGLRAQYTNETNTQLAAVRRNLRKHGLGQDVHANLYSDGSIRIVTWKNLTPVDFRLAVTDIANKAGLKIKTFRMRIEKDPYDMRSKLKSRTAVIQFRS